MADKKTIILISLFLLIYFFAGIIAFGLTGKINGSPDFFFHYDKAIGQSEKQYSPAYYFFFSPFAINQFTFWAINLFLVFGVMPLIIYYLTKTNWGILIYFCGISFSWETMFSATFPSALIMALFLLYLFFRENKNKAIFFFLFGSIAALSHSYGLMLFFGIFLAETALFLKKKLLFLLPVLFSIGGNAKATLDIPARVLQLDSETIIYSTILFLPLPTLFYGLKKIDLFSIIMCFFALFGSLTNFRSLIVFQLLFCISAAKAIKEKNQPEKNAFLVFLVLNFFLYLLTFGLASIELLAYF